MSASSRCRVHVISLIALAWLHPLSTAGAQQRAKVMSEVQIRGSDYAYVNVPATMKRGLTLFSFRNEGAVRHEMLLYRLDSGQTPTQMLERFRAGARGKDLPGRAAGVLILPGGESSIGSIAMHLRRGEEYLIMCSLRDNSTAPMHIDKGMFTSFTVR